MAVVESLDQRHSKLSQSLLRKGDSAAQTTVAQPCPTPTEVVERRVSLVSNRDHNFVRVTNKLEETVFAWAKDQGLEGCYVLLHNTRVYQLSQPQHRAANFKAILKQLDPKSKPCFLTVEMTDAAREAGPTETVFDGIFRYVQAIVERNAARGYSGQEYVRVLRHAFRNEQSSPLHGCLPNAQSGSDSVPLLESDPQDSQIASVMHESLHIA
jgi:hypothetical protein